ncbi:MAG TPA: SRPBCC domain-containing protein [Caulobacteraceae bacterium]|jgi:uncharacterized protein YndB with AHSA1/START domain
MAEGLARFIDRWTVEFMRIYPHPIERVWRAVTDPKEVAIWFIRPTVWEPVTGGDYRFHDDSFAGVVQLVEAPRLIRFGPRADTAPDVWPGAASYFQFELEPAEGGTRLRYLQHAAAGVVDPDEPDPDFVSPGRPGSLAGWHGAFDELGHLLKGTPLRDRLPPTRLTEIARNWASMGMSAEFTPDQKKRIIIGLRARERWFDYVDAYREHVRATRPSAIIAEGR